MNAELISHAVDEPSLKIALKNIADKITNRGDLPHTSISKQLNILEDLTKFEFGRYLIKNQGGWNGFWTHYVLTFPEHGKITQTSSDGSPLTKLESFMLCSSPVILATQQRYKIFLAENQKYVKNGNKLACIPSGLLGELLYLNYNGITDIQIEGLDLDLDSLKQAQKLAQDLGVPKSFLITTRMNAWDLNIQNKYNLISSNGLNIYESNHEKLIKLYKKFCLALTDDGVLVTSYLEKPPSFSDHSTWKADHNAIVTSMTIFKDILGSTWQNFNSQEEITQQLTQAGFRKFDILPDDNYIFPTIVAYK